jgi:hypothetical protein
MLYWVAGFNLTTLVVIGTDWIIDSCKSNYHTIMTTTTPHATLEIIVDIQYLSVKREKYKETKSLEIICH